MRGMSIAGWMGCGHAGLARRLAAAGLCCGCCLVAVRAVALARPVLDLTHNRVCPNSPHPSLPRGGRGAQAHSRVLPMKDAGFALARLPPGSHQATATTTWPWPGRAAPEAIAGSHGTRRV